MKLVPPRAQSCLAQQAVAQADDFLIAKALQTIGQATDTRQEADHPISYPSSILDGFHQIHQPPTLSVDRHSRLMRLAQRRYQCAISGEPLGEYLGIPSTQIQPIDIGRELTVFQWTELDHLGPRLAQPL